MIPLKILHIKDIVKEIGGEIIHGPDDYFISGVTLLAERLKDKQIIFHRFKSRQIKWDQYQKYQSCAIVTDDLSDFKLNEPNITIIIVSDIDKAYWKFIDYYRSLFSIPVIGVTGTCGKTTTKEMIKHILSTKYNVQATYGSANSIFNNIYYLTDIDDETQVAVFEMGVSMPRNLRNSCRHFRPDIRVMTNIGIDHIQGCKSFENYLKAKMELLEDYTFKGVLILNADDENIKKIDLSKFQGKIVYFGFGEKAHFRATNIRYAKDGMIYNLSFKDKKYKFYVPGYGRHNVYNALAAIAAVHAIGFDMLKAGTRLEYYKHIHRHLEFLPGIHGCTVIDDSFSSNPTSTENALKVLKENAQGKKTIVVLGTMTMLGDTSSYYHSFIGQKIVDIGINVLITIGDDAKAAGTTALQAGMGKNNVYFCNNAQQVLNVLDDIIDKNSIVLLKDNHDSLKDVLVHITSK